MKLAGLLGPPLLLVSGVAQGAADAGGWRFGGDLKLTATASRYAVDDLAAIVDGRNSNRHDLDLRLKLDRRRGPWGFEFHYELIGVDGGGTGLPDDRLRLFNLTAGLEDESGRKLIHRVDRLALTWAGRRNVIRFGRQVLSWGNGLVFNPVDFVNPFAPLSIDRDYKTGDDMLYYQHLFDGGEDLQLALIPRRDPQSGELAGRQATAAVKLHGRRGSRELDLLVAHHYGDDVLALGSTRDWHGGVWRFDLMVVRTVDGEQQVMLVSNLDRSWQWADRNVYGYVEYFRNGFGSAQRRYREPVTALQQRIARGELYTLGRDYLAGGLQWEWSARLNILPVAVVNINDGSSLVQLGLQYDWRRNVMLGAGVQLAGGGRGTEYGGFLAGDGGGYIAPGDSAWLRAALYF